MRSVPFYTVKKTATVAVPLLCVCALLALTSYMTTRDVEPLTTLLGESEPRKVMPRRVRSEKRAKSARHLMTRDGGPPNVKLDSHIVLQKAEKDKLFKQKSVRFAQDELVKQLEKFVSQRPEKMGSRGNETLQVPTAMALLTTTTQPDYLKLWLGNREEVKRGQDSHIMQYANEIKRKKDYPTRLNMGLCPPAYGRIGVFVGFRKEQYDVKYKIAQASLLCYLKSVNYTLFLVNLYEDPEVQVFCKHDDIFFLKHCAASVYLKKVDWMLVLDADTAVVNPNHCIEEYIDERVDLVFYERYFNWEIMSGNYLVKNSPFGHDFLQKWADWQYKKPPSWNGADNGVLQIHILQTVLPGAKAETRACDNLWHMATDYDTYMAYVTCVKVNLGANRLFPGKLRILRRGHGMARDGFLAGDAWCENDFLFHGYKQVTIGENNWASPYLKPCNVSECGRGYAGWYWRDRLRKPCDEIRKDLASFEAHTAQSYPKKARIFPHLSLPDVGECWPFCENNT